MTCTERVPALAVGAWEGCDTITARVGGGSMVDDGAGTGGMDRTAGWPAGGWRDQVENPAPSPIARSRRRPRSPIHQRPERAAARGKRAVCGIGGRCARWTDGWCTESRWPGSRRPQDAQKWADTRGRTPQRGQDDGGDMVQLQDGGRTRTSIIPSGTARSDVRPPEPLGA